MLAAGRPEGPLRHQDADLPDGGPGVPALPWGRAPEARQVGD